MTFPPFAHLAFVFYWPSKGLVCVRWAASGLSEGHPCAAEVWQEEGVWDQPWLWLIPVRVMDTCLLPPCLTTDVGIV